MPVASGAVRAEVDGAAALALRLQRTSFAYFEAQVDPGTGLVRDKSAAGAPASIAASGFALAAWAIGSERGWLARSEATARTLRLLRFLQGSDQSGRADASGHRGFYFHFLDMASGRRAQRSELSSIDSALLIAGVLFAGSFFTAESAAEHEIRTLSRALYERVEWDWMLAGSTLLCHGWRPGRGFMPYHWQGYSEALMLMLLALGSPTHPVPPAVYAEWTAGYRRRRFYGTDYLHAGPLFTHQMSHAWVDLRGIRDAPMQASDSDYFDNSRRATYVQQAYAMRQRRFADYGEHAWGLSASDGPGPARREVAGRRRRYLAYASRGVPFGPDDGTLAPGAVAASLPFAPELVVPGMAKLEAMRAAIDPASAGGSAFCPEFGEGGWVSPYRFGIVEGVTLLLAEAHATGRVWDCMRTCSPLLAGLRAAGFSGSWLAP